MALDFGDALVLVLVGDLGDALLPGDQALVLSKNLYVWAVLRALFVNLLLLVLNIYRMIESVLLLNSFLLLVWTLVIPKIISLCHEESTTNIFWTFLTIPLKIFSWSLRLDGQHLTRRWTRLNLRSLPADGLMEGIALTLFFELLQFDTHHFVLLLQLLDSINVRGNVLEARVFLLEDKQLLVNVEDATFAIEVQDLFEVLDFLLELED